MEEIFHLSLASLVAEGGMMGALLYRLHQGKGGGSAWFFMISLLMIKNSMVVATTPSSSRIEKWMCPLLWSSSSFASFGIDQSKLIRLHYLQEWIWQGAAIMMVAWCWLIQRGKEGSECLMITTTTTTNTQLSWEATSLQKITTISWKFFTTIRRSKIVAFCIHWSLK